MDCLDDNSNGLSSYILPIRISIRSYSNLNGYLCKKTNSAKWKMQNGRYGLGGEDVVSVFPRNTKS